VALNKARHTLKGIEENGTFSLNVTAAKQMVEMDYCGITTGGHTDKSNVFTSFYGRLKTAPMAEECPANIECKVFETVKCGSHDLVIGEIVEVYVSKDCMVDGTPDTQRIDPVIYAGGHYWQLGKHIGKGFSAGKAYKKK
jgi:flavin reductase (DIM6/NTAB) family NADH-FMN oxidoreductase RutF